MEELSRLNLMASLGYLAILVFFVVAVLFLFISEKRGAEFRDRQYREMVEKGPSQGRRDLAYQILNGELHLEDARLAALRPQLDLLVDVIYRHRMKLCARAGLDFEDADLEKIFSAYEQLNQLYADEMYDRGWYDARARGRVICRKRKTRKKQGSGY